MLEHRATLEPSIHEEDQGRLQGMGPGMSGHQEYGANGGVAPQTTTLLDSRVGEELLSIWGRFWVSVRSPHVRDLASVVKGEHGRHP